MSLGAVIGHWTIRRRAAAAGGAAASATAVFDSALTCVMRCIIISAYALFLAQSQLNRLAA